MFRTAALALLLTLQSAQDSKSSAPLSLGRLVPKDALFLVSARDLDDLRADFEKGAWYGLYQDDEMKAMRGWVEEAVRKMKESTPEAPSDIDPWACVQAIHGSAALFGTHQTGSKAPSVGLLLDPGEPRGAFEDLSAKLLDELKGEPGTVATTEDYSGVELRLFETAPKPKSRASDAESSTEEHDEQEGDEPAPDGDDPMRHFAYFEHRGVAGFVVSPAREELLQVVHGIVDRASGKDASAGIEGAPSLAQARSSVAKSGRIEFYLDLAAVIQWMRAEEAPKADEEKVLEKLGVDGLRWIYASADLGKGEAVSFDLAVRIPEKGYLKDWIGFLGKAPKELAAGAPREAVAVSIAQYDVWGLWQSVWKFVADIEPDGAERARAQMEEGLSQVGAGDIEKSLISQIDGRFLSFNVPIPEDEWKAQMSPALPQGSTGGVGHQGSAMLFGLRDVHSVSSYVEGILKAIGAFDAVKTEDFQGNQVYRFDMGGSAIHWAFTKQGLSISQSPSAIRAALRMEGSEKKDSALEKEAFKPLYDAHTDASVLGLATTAESLKSGLLAIEAMRTMAGMGAMMSGKSGEPDLGPLAHLPSAAAIDRHFKGTTVSTISRTGGVLHVQMACK